MNPILTIVLTHQPRLLSRDYDCSLILLSPVCMNTPGAFPIVPRSADPILLTGVRYWPDSGGTKPP